MEHSVKCWPQFFKAIGAGEKTHDLRRSDDRQFAVGDTLMMHEFDPAWEQYTGRALRVLVTYITSMENPCALSGEGLHPRFCILSISRM